MPEPARPPEFHTPNGHADQVRLDITSLDSVADLQADIPSLAIELDAKPEIPEYDQIQEVAKGGFATVYRARQISLNRPVALKVIHSIFNKKIETLQRFIQEAQILAQLIHPRIVQIYDFGQLHGSAYIVMEYVEGGSLYSHVSREPMPPRQAALNIRSLAEGLHYAHENGIIHRDLKPGNILIGPEGRLKLTDFGLAVFQEEAGGITKTKELLGTPCYMAPEQLQPRYQANRACDIYGIGSVLYEMLTGKPPFRADAPLAVINLVEHSRPIPPRTLNPTISPDLEAICLKCLEKRPADRYPTARALAEDLDRFLEGHAIQARPLGRAKRWLRWIQRHPKLSLVTASLALLTVAVTLVAFYHDRSMRSQVTQAVILTEQRLMEQLEMARRSRKSAELLISQLQNSALTPSIVEAAESTYRRAIQDFSSLTDYPLLRAAANTELAECYRNLGRLFRTVGDWENARVQYLLSMEYSQSVLDLRPVLYAQLGLAYCQLEIGFLAGRGVSRDQAHRYLQDAVTSLRQLHQANPTHQRVTYLLARCLANRAMQYHDLRHLTQAQQIVQESLELHRSLFVRVPEDFENVLGLADTYQKMCTIVDSQGHVAQADLHLQSALEILEQAMIDHPNQVSLQVQLGYMYVQQCQRFLASSTIMGLEAKVLRVVSHFDNLHERHTVHDGIRQGLEEAHRVAVAFYRQNKQADWEWAHRIKLLQVHKLKPEHLGVKYRDAFGFLEAQHLAAALQIMNEMKAALQQDTGNPWQPYNLACLYAKSIQLYQDFRKTENTSFAVHFLDLALRRGLSLEQLQLDPDLAPLRSTPLFTDLLWRYAQ